MPRLTPWPYTTSTRLAPSLALARVEPRYNNCLCATSPRLRAPRLFEELRLCHADGSFRKRLAAIARMIAWRSLHASHQPSTLPLDHWHDYIGDPTLDDTIVGRLLHDARKIPLDESMRKKQTIADRTNICLNAEES